MPQAQRLRLPAATAREQVEGRALWNDGRSASRADFFTLGYTGRKVEDMLTLLSEAGVRTLVDIRQNAVSMYRPELSKTNLRRVVERGGMRYVHYPELGVPRDIRARAISAGSRSVIWDWYDEQVASRYCSQNLHRFFNGIEHPAAYLCVEIDPHECHRHRLALALEALGLMGFDL